MKILMINIMCGIKSTGRICTDLAYALEDKGNEVRIAYGRENVPEEFLRYAHKIDSNIDILTHGIKARLFDADGFGSKRATKRLIEWIEDYNPDVIHLHNLHGYYINIELLFKYLKQSGKRVIWTLHDCWSFTGHCTFFENAKCEKWKTGCKKCQQKKEYPASILFDNSRRNYKRKKELFMDIEKLSFVTPSNWLADLLSNSFLKEYPVNVINNGINTSVFYHRESSILEKIGIKSVKMVLGVATPWSERKGFNDFLALSKILPDEYKIVLVGLSREQKEMLPSNILGIERTDSADELAQLYSSAYVFVNPTYEDNYPTTNIEAIACGTPVITYNTGGSVESVAQSCIVEKGDIKGIADIILNNKLRIPENMDVSKERMLEKYLDLYNAI